MPAKTKTKELDLDRQTLWDPRDPRAKSGPCRGHHPATHTAKNQHGEWVDCARCGLRLQYTPFIGAPGTYVKNEPAPLVEEALDRLHDQGTWENMNHKQVKAMIAIVTAEKKLGTGRSTASTQAGPKSKNGPASSTHGPRPKKEEEPAKKEEKTVPNEARAMSDPDESPSKTGWTTLAEEPGRASDQ